MKAKLEFDIDNPEDKQALKQCVNAEKMAGFIWELKFNFWRRWKHDESDFNLDTYKEALYDLMQEHNINPDELYK